MINTWLNRTNRSNQLYSFNVIDISEQFVCNDDIRNYLGGETLEQYRSINYLKNQYENESQQKLSVYLKNDTFPNIDRFINDKQNQPTKNVRQGDFGEILTTLVIEHFTNLKVPISKLRYKFNNDRSVFCTDLISHNQGDTIVDITYYEIKTRITKDKDSAMEAYEGLLKDEQKSAEGVADFLSRYYHEIAEVVEKNMGDASALYDLADKFGDVVKNSQNYNRRFEIVLIIEKDKFEETSLENLNNITLQLLPLEVTVILIENLKDLVDETYNRAVNAAINYVFGSSLSNMAATQITTP